MEKGLLLAQCDDHACTPLIVVGSPLFQSLDSKPETNM